MSSYQQTLDFLYRQLPMYQREGVTAFKKNLSNIKALLKILNNPHKSLNIIHIAGTNGKGSVTHMTASMLQEMGYSVACYTSPHYKDFRERIKINGEFISEDDVLSFVKRIKPHLVYIKASFFELTVAMAFDYFSKQSPDFCIIETGLGGRLDSTNVVRPILSIITNISYDHQDMLGDTLEEIAQEKAGIIKADIPVLIGEFQNEIHHVFEEKALSTSSPLKLASAYLNNIKLDKDVVLNDQEPAYFTNNKLTSIAAIYLLHDLAHIIKPTIDDLSNGLHNIHKNCYFLGRNMTLSTDPLTIADSGHNEAGIRSLMQYIQGKTYHQLHIVCGFVKDKNLADIIPFFPRDARYYFTQAKVPRAMPAVTIKEYFEQRGFDGAHYISSKEALKLASREADSKDLVLICGSIFLVAELI